MIDGWYSFYSIKPDILDEIDFYRITFPQTEVGEKVGEKLTPNQQKIIEHIMENPYISAKELSEFVGISQRKIEENIAKLKEKGILRRVGPAKGGHWEVLD